MFVFVIILGILNFTNSSNLAQSILSLIHLWKNQEYLTANYILNM